MVDAIHVTGRVFYIRNVKNFRGCQSSDSPHMNSLVNGCLIFSLGTESRIEESSSQISCVKWVLMIDD